MGGLRGGRGWSLLPLLPGLTALLLVVTFDLTSSLPFNDEFIYQWTVRRLAGGHGLTLYPGQAPIALVQLFAGAAAYAVHPDPRLARLTALPFILLSAIALYRLSRRLGASGFWASVAAAALLASPLFAATATGFMTEPYYLGLLALAAWATCRWLAGGRGALLVILAAAAAALQRQHAAAIPPALTLAVLVAARSRSLPPRATAVVLATWVVVLAAELVPALAGLQTAQMRANLAATLHPTIGGLGAAALYLPATTGLSLLAFGIGMVGPLPDGARPWWRRPGVAVMAGVAVLVLWLTYVLPGNYLTRAGLNPVTVDGTKPALFGLVLPLLGGAGLVAFAVAATRPWRAWRSLASRPPSLFLLTVGAFALVPLLNGDVFDRYYLAVVLPWLPLAAAAASRSRLPRVAQAWAVAVLVIGVAVYAAGEQDYQAWQTARQAAEGLATRTVAAADIFSGFETYGVEVVLPEYERGRLSPAFGSQHSTAAMSPAHPRAALVVTGPDDPRPGFSYRSLAPGRVVLVCLDPAGCGFIPGDRLLAGAP